MALTSVQKKQLLRLPVVDASVSTSDKYAFLGFVETAGTGATVDFFSVDWRIDPTWESNELPQSVDGSLDTALAQATADFAGLFVEPPPASVVQTGAVSKVRRVKDRPRPVENTLRPLMESVIRLQVMAERARSSVNVAKIESAKIPRWEQRAKQAQVQVSQLIEVTKDLQSGVNALHEGNVSGAQVQAISGKVERVRDLAVTKPIKEAAEACQGVCETMIEGLP